MIKAKHGKKLWDLLKVLTLIGLVTAALVITPMAPAVAQGGVVSIRVKAGQPTSIPADGRSSTVLVVTAYINCPRVRDALEAYLAGAKSSLVGTVSTDRGKVVPASLSFDLTSEPPYVAEVALVAGTDPGEANITVKIGNCENSTTVTFEQAGASPGEVVPAEPKPPEPGKPKPRLTEEMIDDIAFVVNVGVSRGQEIQPEQLPHWDQLTPSQQEKLRKVLELLELMGFLSQMLK